MVPSILMLMCRSPLSFFITNSTIKIANQRFIVHLHPPEEGNDCEICSVKEDRSNLVPLLEDTSALKTASSVPSNSQVQYHAPMDEKTAKTFTKEEKRENFKSNMQSLRKSLLSGGPASSTSSRQTTPKATSNQAASSIHSQAGLSASEDSSPSVESPRYVDRAKLRRSIHPPQHGLSDADPPHHHQGKRSRFSSPSQNAPPPKTEPSYGPGAALFQKMMTGNETTVPSEKIAGTADSTAINVPSRKEVKLGKIIEVRTMAERSAGLGSGMVRQGVEQHANPMDWRDAARQRRWKEANR